jgi:glutathione S-transferase
VILYATLLSSYSAKVRIVLAAKGLAFEEREPPGGYRSEAYRAIVPTGTVPAIDDDGFVLSESEAIAEYLEECFPAPALLPPDPRDRARSRFLSRFHDLHLEPHVRALFPHVDPARRDAAYVEARLADIRRRIAQLEGFVAAAPYALGPALTLADCGFAVTLPLAKLIARSIGATLVLPPRLDVWLAALDAHPAVASALAAWRPATARWLASQRGATV